MRATSRSSRRLMTRLTARPVLAVLATVATLASTLVVASPADAANRVTPGSFTGYGFDQCTAPTQKAMDAWLTSLAVLGRRHLPLRRLPRLPEPAEPHADLGQHPARQRLAAAADHARPAGLVHHPGALPAPGADQPVVVRVLRHRPPAGPRRGEQDRRAPPSGSGSPPGSTLWYDIEAFSIAKTDCRESALSFLSAWTDQLHALGYVSGIYSSGASGIKMLDDARATRPGVYTMPDQLWIADWNGRADTCVELRPQRRLDAPQADAPVPRRPQRDLRRRDDQHRQQLARPRPRLDARQGAGALRRGGLQLHAPTTRAGPATPAPWSRRPSAC